MMDNTNNLIGEELYWIRDGLYGIGNGVVVRTTPKFCVLKQANGHEKRKSKHLLFESEEKAQLDFIQRVDLHLREHFSMNILEMSKVFKDMMEKYPEKFI